jgi:hypothetical protein
MTHKISPYLPLPTCFCFKVPLTGPKHMPVHTYFSTVSKDIFQIISFHLISSYILHAAALRPWHKYWRFPLGPPGRSLLMRPLRPLFLRLELTQANKKSKTRRKTPSLSSCYRRRSGSPLPLLLLPISGGQACLRLGVSSAPCNEDGDAHTPRATYIGPGWDAASRPHILLPLPFQSIPFHLLPFLFHLNRVNGGKRF